MKTIWKWKLEPFTTIQMPKDARILTVQVQYGKPCLWALVDPTKELCSRNFQVYPTGGNLPDKPGEYIGTLQMHEGNLIFHVYEIIP